MNLEKVKAVQPTPSEHAETQAQARTQVYLRVGLIAAVFLVGVYLFAKHMKWSPVKTMIKAILVVGLLGAWAVSCQFSNGRGMCSIFK